MDRMDSDPRDGRVIATKLRVHNSPPNTKGYSLPSLFIRPLNRANLSWRLYFTTDASGGNRSAAKGCQVIQIFHRTELVPYGLYGPI